MTSSHQAAKLSFSRNTDGLDSAIREIDYLILELVCDAVYRFNSSYSSIQSKIMMFDRLISSLNKGKWRRTEGGKDQSRCYQYL